MGARLVLGSALVLALAAGAWSLAGAREYEARSFAIRLPPEHAGEQGLARARDDAVLERALKLAGTGGHDPRRLRDRSSVELTSRLDLSFTVRSPDRAESVALATAYAQAYRDAIPRRPGMIARVRPAVDAERSLSPLGWAILGGAAGLWLGAALAIVGDARRRARSASAPAPRPASAPCAPARPTTPG